MHEIGDTVKATTIGIFGKYTKFIPKGIEADKVYKIVDIHRGIDGAYDYDDLFLEGFGNRKFCEFDFKTVTTQGDTHDGE